MIQSGCFTGKGWNATRFNDLVPDVFFLYWLAWEFLAERMRDPASELVGQGWPNGFGTS